ncbi:peptidoglycan-binding domain-containing protein [Schaalia sp. lx-100]|uniref:peptidoglycan-binding domain-containing protein n=1 Tax=Schaalia sp. lx-100 TaxID=2899081 RepID=UPI001E2A3A1D|nr:peptidoglycan-binding domain-containing protein [Schaalia sp. lx-100]MCD4557971.1 peptidoglycan-binding protein [Schaalia sp. lx-100]
MTGKKKRFATLILLLFLALSALGVWTVKTLFFAPQLLPHPTTYDEATAHNGTLERKITLVSQITWTDSTHLIANRGGVITQILAVNNVPLEDGQKIASIDMEPIVIVEGTIPAYRDLTSGTEGEDVKQLQAFLKRHEYPIYDKEGIYGPSTQTAVTRWQKENGITPTGDVSLGSMIFVSKLPVSLSWADNIAIGSHISTGDTIGTLSGSHPRFHMLLPEGQAELVKEGMEASITYQDKTWPAIIGTITTNAEGQTIAFLEPPADTETICGEECALIPATGTEGMSTTITVVPQTEGIIVPNTAIYVASDATVYVTDSSGQKITVEVVVSIGGQSIVTGINDGTRLSIPLASIGKEKSDTSTQKDEK